MCLCVWGVGWGGVGSQCCKGDIVGGWSALIGDVPFPLFLCPNKNKNGSCEWECKVDSSQKIRVRVVEEGFPCIRARGYIIISKVNILY